MKRLLASTALVASLVVGTATAAGAAPSGPPEGVGSGGKPSGIACQQQGISTLQSLGLLPAVAKGGIEVQGIGVLDFPTVLMLHRTAPQLFQSGGVTVNVPGIGAVAATWCNGV
jgi:hypothetical protein